MVSGGREAAGNLSQELRRRYAEDANIRERRAFFSMFAAPVLIRRMSFGDVFPA
jgi:hypothetical protein